MKPAQGLERGEDDLFLLFYLYDNIFQNILLFCFYIHSFYVERLVYMYVCAPHECLVPMEFRREH